MNDVPFAQQLCCLKLRLSWGLNDEEQLDNLKVLGSGGTGVKPNNSVGDSFWHTKCYTCKFVILSIFLQVYKYVKVFCQGDSVYCKLSNWKGLCKN